LGTTLDQSVGARGCFITTHRIAFRERRAISAADLAVADRENR